MTVFVQTENENAWDLIVNNEKVAHILADENVWNYHIVANPEYNGWVSRDFFDFTEARQKVIDMYIRYQIESAPEYVKMVRRFFSKIETDEWDDCFCDKVWYDRKTGKAIARYDYADPANRDPEYGGQDTDFDIFESLGFDMNEKIPLSEVDKSLV